MYKRHDIGKIYIGIEKAIANSQIRLTIRQIYYDLVRNQILENSQNEFKNFSRIFIQIRRNSLWFPKIISNSAIIDDYFQVPLVDNSFWIASQRIIEGLKQANYSVPDASYQKTLHLIILEKSNLDTVFQNFLPRNMNIVLLRIQNNQWFNPTEILTMVLVKKIEQVFVSYFGDFDQSSFNLEKRLAKIFSNHIQFQRGEFERVAITPDQINRYNLPENPAKPGQIELEALPPQVLIELLVNQCKKHFDLDILKSVTKLNTILKKRFPKYLSNELKKFTEGELIW